MGFLGLLFQAILAIVIFIAFFFVIAWFLTFEDFVLKAILIIGLVLFIILLLKSVG